VRWRSEDFGALGYSPDKERLHLAYRPLRADRKSPTAEFLERGLRAPICITWELTRSCNLHCLHCLSSSGKGEGGELSSEEAERLIDELAEMQVFYVNFGGGEPFLRPDLFEILKHCIRKGLGVKISTNGTLLDRRNIERLAELKGVDIQVSLDGATPEVNDRIRGRGSFERAVRALGLLREYGIKFRINMVVTRLNFHQLDAVHRMARDFGAGLRLSRFRPSGRGRELWNALRLTREQNIALSRWLAEHPETLTGDSFFHLTPVGKGPPGLNTCGAGRMTCSVAPNGDVYPCAFLTDGAFLAGNIKERPLAAVWRDSPVFRKLRGWQPGTCRGCTAFSLCRGGCIAARHFAGVDPEAPDPECVLRPDG